MKTLQGRVAAITGASSGIGRALAEELASSGAHLALSDVDEVGLAETRKRCDKLGARVHTQTLDVTDREAVEAWADEVVAHYGLAHMIFNNAGIALHGSFEEIPHEVFEKVMDVDFWGVVHGTRAFLPHLKRVDDAHIVNISSVFGIIGVIGQSPYNAAKFAVRGFTECLVQEMDALAPHVHVTSVHPGGIKTNIAKAASFVGKGLGDVSPDRFASRFDRLAQTSPEQCAQIILRGVLANKPRVLVGNDALVIDIVQRLLPARYHDLVMRQYGRVLKVRAPRK